ncbi:hypothetical protein [Polymorphospora lycopeni]|uniref:Uncharacterized protein n=1 Tax=Polymorphospora lycopeni TaxID=3140240 RepID=A0ABV5CKZ8_9ACTN
MSLLTVTSDDGQHWIELVEVDDAGHHAGACTCGWQTSTDRPQTLEEAVDEAKHHVDNA